MKKGRHGQSFKEINDLALKIRSQYDKFEVKAYGRSWKREELMQGLVSDIGDLMREIMKQSGLRPGKNREILVHDICDCFWSILVLADKYKIDLSKEFPKQMEKLSNIIKDKNKKLKK